MSVFKKPDPFFYVSMFTLFIGSLLSKLLKEPRCSNRKDFKIFFCDQCFYFSSRYIIAQKMRNKAIA
jgi:hypothetical protein